MRIPDRLKPLLDLGVLDEVVRPLMSGKEASVYLVRSDGELRVAKVYKEASQRSFKHRADYTEGRRTRNSRTERAMAKRSKFGREQVEAAWRSAEVDAIYRLRDADVRVPEPFAFVDGVLVMELVQDDDGEPAPRLVDADFTADEAEAIFQTLIKEVVKMLLAGVVHGDLSDFNVLITPTGPVIIDFPQAVDPAFNNNAKKLFVRDVDNLTSFLGRHSGDLRKTKYGEEIWDKYERNALTIDTPLTGKAPKAKKKADVGSLLDEIRELEEEALRRREAAGIVQKSKFHKEVEPLPTAEEFRRIKRAQAPPADDGSKKKKKRRRRKRKKGGGGGDQTSAPPAKPPQRSSSKPSRKSKPPKPSAPDPLDDWLTIEDE